MIVEVEKEVMQLQAEAAKDCPEPVEARKRQGMILL